MLSLSQGYTLGSSNATANTVSGNESYAALAMKFSIITTSF